MYQKSKGRPTTENKANIHIIFTSPLNTKARPLAGFDGHDLKSI